MFDTSFVHSWNIIVCTQRRSFGKHHVSHLAAGVFDDDKLLGVPVRQGLDFVCHIEMLREDAADGVNLFLGCLAVELYFLSSFSLVEHINGIVDIPFDDVH